MRSIRDYDRAEIPNALADLEQRQREVTSPEARHALAEQMREFEALERRYIEQGVMRAQELWWPEPPRNA